MRVSIALLLGLSMSLVAACDPAATPDAGTPSDVPAVDAPSTVDSPSTLDAPAVLDAPSPLDAPSMPDDTVSSCVIDELAIGALTEGLFFTSEGDEPITVTSFDGETGAAPTAANVLRLSGASPGSVTEMRTVEEFFARVVIDPTAIPAIDPARPAMLRAAVEAAWTDLTVVRVIDPAEPVRVRVYLVGRSSCGALAWLRTISIET